LAISTIVILSQRCSVSLSPILLRTVSVLLALDIGIREGYEFSKSGEGILACLELKGAFEQSFLQLKLLSYHRSQTPNTLTQRIC
jgi:hypothetical protein